MSVFPFKVALIGHAHPQCALNLSCDGIVRVEYNYLTIIPRARVGYEMVDSQRGVAELAITIISNKARVE